ncbi:MAG TPA: porin [Polyangia bacterium]
MRRLRASTLRLASAMALAAVFLSSGRAAANVTFFDDNGWSIYTTGLIAAHYQLTTGDGDPSSLNPQGGVLLGGKFLTSQVQTSGSGAPTVTLSRLRSGFVGTQIGFGVNRRISDQVHVESLMAVNLEDISSDRGQSPSKGVDFREAWASLVTPYGSLKFGRMFSIFGSASAEVVLIAYRFGVGNPCTLSSSVIGCGSVGAGPLYAGFDAQMRYISPRIGGFQLQVAVVDPTRSQTNYLLTPVPRIDAELSYDHTFGATRLRLIGQGMSDQPEKQDATMQKLNVWGVMGAGIVDVAGLTVAGGGWTGAGIGTHVPLETEDPTYPIAFDGTGETRLFRGFFGNVAYDYQGTALAVGGGALFVRPTADDKITSAYSILAQNQEFHAVLSHKMDTIVFTAEYMRWTSKWHYGELQNMNFGGVGVNYFW